MHLKQNTWHVMRHAIGLFDVPGATVWRPAAGLSHHYMSNHQA